ncbi:MAG: endo alpha-1,4 polygalactosaminidase [Candidatus Rifleibacteriota bacterium]
MKKNILSLLLVFVFSTVSAFGWQFVATGEEITASNGIVVLDPDCYSRAQLQELVNKGLTPVAWLNVCEVEDWRIMPLDIRAKNYVLDRKKSPQNLKFARFYSQAFTNILVSRVREYMLKGFEGILLARADYFKLVSNNPLNKRMMWQLVLKITEQAARYKSDPLILLEGETFVEETLINNKIDGVITSGLFNDKNGKHIHPWQRKKRLKKVEPLLNNDCLLLTVEASKTGQQKLFVKEKCNELGIDYCFDTIPLKMNRRDFNGKSK